MRTLALLILVAGLSIPSRGAEPASRGSSRSSENNSTAERDLIGWNWANFVLLAGVLAYFGVKFGRPYFDGQTQLIRRGLEEAQAARVEADRRSAELQSKLDHLGAQIEDLRKSALVEQTELAENLRQKSERDLQRVWANAEQQIETAGQHARWELQQFASGLALDLAEKRIRGRMDESLQHELTGQFVRNLKN